MKTTSFSGAFMSMRNDYVIPESLKSFLSHDDLGMEGLEFMLKDSKLAKRIPQDVRLEYEILYATINSDIDKQIAKLRKQLDELEKNPKKAIHEIIEHSYANNK